MLKLIKILSLTLLFSILTSCSSPSDDYADKKSIIVATSADNPPYEFLKDGEVVGLDIDIINAIGEKLGKEIIIKNIDFPSLIPSLTTGTVDVVIAALSVTDQRRAKVDFSRGYLSATMEILFKDGQGYRRIEDFANKNIGVQTGSTWELYAKSLKERFPNMQITSLTSNLVLVETLKSDNIDAVIFEEVQVNKFKEKNEGLDSFVLKDTQAEFAIATQKDSGLVEKINKAIDQLQLEGKLYPLKTKWLSE